MHVKRLDQLERCWSIAAAWDCMAHGVPFRRTAWLLSWWKHFHACGDLFVLQVTDAQDQVVGIAPWYIDTSLRQGRVVRPLGSGNTCSDYLGILATSEHGPAVSAALTRWLVEAAAGTHGPDNRWDLLDLLSIDAQDCLMGRFVEQLANAGNHIHRRDAMSCWRIELPDSWEAYLALLSKSHRKRLRRLDRKWLENDTVQFRVVHHRQELDRIMSTLIDLHQQRQERVGHAGCFADARFAEFLHEAAGRLLDEQMLRLCWLDMDGVPAAAEFQLTTRDTTYAYLGGMSNALQDSSPGQIIQTAILKRCIDEKQQVFDFLRGAESYKSHWGVREYPCHDYRIVPHRPTAQLRHQVWLAGGAMKEWVKAGLQITGVH